MHIPCRWRPGYSAVRNLLRDSISPPSSTTYQVLRSGLCQRSGQKFCGGASTRYAYISSLANLDLKNRCCSYACQKRCQRHQCHWLEARWRFSMSIIQDDFTGAIVSRRSSIKRTPPLGSSSSHQLSLSRTIKEPFRLLGHGVKGGQSIYTPQVTHCAISPFGEVNLYHARATWLSTPLRNCVQPTSPR